MNKFSVSSSNEFSTLMQVFQKWCNLSTVSHSLATLCKFYIFFFSAHWKMKNKETRTFLQQHKLWKEFMWVSLHKSGTWNKLLFSFNLTIAMCTTISSVWSFRRRVKSSTQPMIWRDFPCYKSTVYGGPNNLQIVQICELKIHISLQQEWYQKHSVVFN